MSMSANPNAFVRQENARLKQENEELRDEVSSLREFVHILESLTTKSERFKSDAELMPFLDDTLIKTLSLLNAPDGTLALLDDETNELVFVIVKGSLSDELTGYRFPADQGIMGWVMQRREPVVVRDVKRDLRFSDMVDEAFKYRTQSILAAPLVGNQKCFGVIEILNQPGDEPFSETDAALLNLLCRATGEALADIERLGPTG